MRCVARRRREPAAATHNRRHSLLHKRRQKPIALRRGKHPVRERVAVREPRRHQPGSIDHGHGTHDRLAAPADRDDPPVADTDVSTERFRSGAIHHGPVRHHGAEIHAGLPALIIGLCPLARIGPWPARYLRPSCWTPRSRPATGGSPRSGPPAQAISRAGSPAAQGRVLHRVRLPAWARRRDAGVGRPGGRAGRRGERSTGRCALASG